ncbi:putative S-adenosylmethionine-dependent methyltransferase [Spironucleus salmonicida]|uniref:Trimethylguanosine synthase n=1 Tax=Spironucleus salmonicida TaxID=348837 RepID=V6LB40_9EUKA|nr:putative S-adenosylmethionine-dependent methyltransferase [Spironucleus salmonicida]|eukprot:EST41655.1 RNA cap guanine-N2 methyltransferase domain-containing protein [Spironucleus salmonicida]
MDRILQSSLLRQIIIKNYKFHYSYLLLSNNSYYRQLNQFTDRILALDNEMLYSINPDQISLFIADKIKKMKAKYILELFAGAGALTNILTQQFNVVAVEINCQRCEMIQANVINQQRLTLVAGDAFKTSMKNFDFVCMAPPWGGENYDRTSFDLLRLTIGGQKYRRLIKNLGRNRVQSCQILPKSIPKLHIQKIFKLFVKYARDIFINDNQLESTNYQCEVYEHSRQGRQKFLTVWIIKKDNK